MKSQVNRLTALLVAALFVFSGIAFGQDANQEQQWKSTKQDSMQGSSSKSVQPDNSGVNKRDRRDEEMTSDKQGQSKTDIELTRKIRRAIMEDDSLSTYGHNVKIIARNGMVTLKGPVHSEQEKAAIEAKAVAVAGAGKIKNELEIKGKQTGKTAPNND